MTLIYRKLLGEFSVMERGSHMKGPGSILGFEFLKFFVAVRLRGNRWRA